MIVRICVLFVLYSNRDDFCVCVFYFFWDTASIGVRYVMCASLLSESYEVFDSMRLSKTVQFDCSYME